MARYKYLFFDLDGTLTHSHPGIFFCLKKTLEALGKKYDYSDDFLRQCVGPPLYDSFYNIFRLTEEEAEEGVRLYREFYAADGVFRNSPIEGAAACLQSLQEVGYILALATTKAEYFAKMVTDKFDFTPYFAKVAGSNPDKGITTKAGVIESLLTFFGAKPDECLMIGDRKHDAEGAAEMGVDCALLPVGYAEDGEIEGCSPKYVFQDFGELKRFLLKDE